MVRVQPIVDLISRLIDIYRGDNYGQFDAMIAQFVLGANNFRSPEIPDEFGVFESQIKSALHMDYSEFMSILTDPSRGYNEIDDDLKTRVYYRTKSDTDTPYLTIIIAK